MRTGRPSKYGEPAAILSLRVPQSFYDNLTRAAIRLGMPTVDAYRKWVADLLRNERRAAKIEARLNQQWSLNFTIPTHPPIKITNLARRIKDTLPTTVFLDGECVPFEFDEQGYGDYYTPSIFVRMNGKWIVMINPVKPDGSVPRNFSKMRLDFKSQQPPSWPDAE